MGTELAGCDLTGADLRDADRRGADLPVLDLTEVKLDVGQAIQVARCLGAEVDLEG